MDTGLGTLCHRRHVLSCCKVGLGWPYIMKLLRKRVALTVYFEEHTLTWEDWLVRCWLFFPVRPRLGLLRRMIAEPFEQMLKGPLFGKVPWRALSISVLEVFFNVQCSSCSKQPWKCVVFIAGTYVCNQGVALRDEKQNAVIFCSAS